MWTLLPDWHTFPWLDLVLITARLKSYPWIEIKSIDYLVPDSSLLLIYIIPNLRWGISPAIHVFPRRKHNGDSDINVLTSTYTNLFSGDNAICSYMAQLKTVLEKIVDLPLMFSFLFFCLITQVKKWRRTSMHRSVYFAPDDLFFIIMRCSHPDRLCYRVYRKKKK